MLYSDSNTLDGKKTVSKIYGPPKQFDASKYSIVPFSMTIHFYYIQNPRFKRLGCKW